MGVAGRSRVIGAVQAVIWVLGLIISVIPDPSCQHECILAAVEPTEDKIVRRVALVLVRLQRVATVSSPQVLSENLPGEIWQVIAPSADVVWNVAVLPIELAQVLIGEIVVLRVVVTSPKRKG